MKMKKSLQEKLRNVRKGVTVKRLKNGATDQTLSRSCGTKIERKRNEEMEH